MPAAPDGYPFRQAVVVEREVEHVHHGPVEERGIAALGGEEHRPLGEGAAAEEQAVEGAVDDVAQGAGQHQGHADHQQAGCALAGDAAQVPADAEDRRDAEQGEGQLAPFPAELQPEGHAAVLDEVDVGLVPARDQREGRVVEHGELHPDLEHLVGGHHEAGDEQGTPEAEDGGAPGGRKGVHGAWAACRVSRSSAAWPRCSTWHEAPGAGVPC